MTTFTNGPAQGQTLMLKRAPRFLRVVEAAGKWDALDQLEDQPQPNETIHVYVLQGKPGSVHLNRGRGRGGWYVFANYQIYPQQPTDDQMRSTAKWRSWCQIQSLRVMTVAQFIFKHFCRIRRSGLKPTSWALLLWLSDRGECWSTRQQIVQALAWLKGGNGMHITIIRDLVERKLVERSNLGGRGEGRAAYRITPAGIAFLKLPVAEATHNAH